MSNFLTTDKGALTFVIIFRPHSFFPHATTAPTGQTARTWLFPLSQCHLRLCLQSTGPASARPRLACLETPQGQPAALPPSMHQQGPAGTLRFTFSLADSASQNIPIVNDCMHAKPAIPLLEVWVIGNNAAPHYTMHHRKFERGCFHAVHSGTHSKGPRHQYN